MKQTEDPHILVLGSGTSQSLADRACPALLLRTGRDLTLLDMGPGTLGRLAKAGVPHSDLNRILITHFHPDHTAGLIHFLFATRHPPALSVRKPFRLVGPEGTGRLLSGLEQAYGRWIRLPSHVMEVEEWPLNSEEEKAFGPLRVSAARVRHTDRSLAYRVSTPGRKAIVYSGDTGYCDELIALANGCDLLILECSLPEDLAVEGHLTPRLAGKLAAAAGAAKLLLVHFYPEVLAVDIAAEVRESYQGELVLGRDLLTVRP